MILPSLSGAKRDPQNFCPLLARPPPDLPNIIQRILTTFCLKAFRTNVIMAVTPENVSHHMKPWAPFLSCTVIPIRLWELLLLLCLLEIAVIGKNPHTLTSFLNVSFASCPWLPLRKLFPLMPSSSHFSPIILPSLGSEVRYEFSLSLIAPSGSFFLPSSLTIITVEFQVFKL